MSAPIEVPATNGERGTSQSGARRRLAALLRLEAHLRRRIEVGRASGPVASSIERQINALRWAVAELGAKYPSAVAKAQADSERAEARLAERAVRYGA
ncbi:hypothetical protein AnaeK_2018 [Anaeromyxobacter sp. K]|uniref:hypothetical protein n=1 Tax=Anaeromyxobacter sp. (strain K) TaxID=447217 RepID=UPI00015F88F6|nr:hypothetical protein [Anaeromyxobacter sp. K]ACG73246.1 hypothetical protein AnaeK_2018 [Anaeromyxobacter sp. K]